MTAPTQREIAKHLGVSAPQVSKLVARGMPTESFEAAAKWHVANIRPMVSAKAKAAQRSEKPDPYQVARTSREVSDAKMAALTLLERRGVLVHRDKVRAELARRLAGLREALLQMPARLQSELAAETDEAKCHDILQDEIYSVLQSVAGVTG